MLNKIDSSQLSSGFKLSQRSGLNKHPGTKQVKLLIVKLLIDRGLLHRHRINVNNPSGKNRIQAVQSKVRGPNNDTGKR